MVRTVLLTGVGRAWLSHSEMAVTVAMLGEEALEALSRRSYDAIAVGNVPDRGQADLIAAVRSHSPWLPIVAVGDSGGDPSAVWEQVPTSALDRLAGVLARAAEVGWLRRERDRLERATHGAQPREVGLAFEQGSIREMERLMIVGRLERLNQNRTRSAQSLDISVRTLRNKLREYRTAAAGRTALTD